MYTLIQEYNKPLSDIYYYFFRLSLLSMQDQYDYDYDNYEQEYNYDNSQEYPEDNGDAHSSHQSEERHYNFEPYQIFPLEKLIQELNTILEEVKMLVYLDKGWCLLLLKEFKWDKEILREEYYNNIEQYQKKIGLRESLIPFQQCRKELGYCYVCCCDGVMTVQNICGHQFCLDCWVSGLKNSIHCGNPFMLCMDVSCGVPLLMEVIQGMLTLAEEPSLLKKWRKRVCQLLIMENRNYQFCTGIDCGNCIKINQLDIDTVKCSCGKVFCFRCQSDDHYPCKCDQKARWSQQVISQEADAKWISANAKICPWCRKAVERSMGCNFMSCTCGKNFCYMCSQPWEPDHKDHFKCHIYKKKPDETVNREKEALERMNHCTQRFIFNQAVANNYKEIDVFSKRKYLFKVLGIELMESEFMETAYKFAIECCEKLKWIYAFTYFTEMKQRKEAFQFSLGEYQKYKQNLLKLLAVDLKQFIAQTQEKNKEYQGKLDQFYISKLQDRFRGLKKTIVNLYTCTKNYKEKFVEELSHITENLDHEREIEEMKNYTVKTKSEPKFQKEEEEKGGLLNGIMSWGKSKTKSKRKK